LIIPKLAAIINHAAIDFAIPIPCFDMFFNQKNGMAHSPQANAVINE
jgi:hypothetical protein